MPEVTLKRGLVKDCCKKAENLEAKQIQPDLTVLVCQVCGCRHFRAKAELGNLISRHVVDRR